MSQAIKKVTDSSFETEVLGSEVPVLVDYWAEWCGPCKMITPLLDDTVASYAGRLSVAKLNIDENTKTPSQYHVRSIPTLMLFRDGQPIATRVGALSKSQLNAFLDDNL